MFHSNLQLTNSTLLHASNVDAGGVWRDETRRLWLRLAEWKPWGNKTDISLVPEDFDNDPVFINVNPRATLNDSPLVSMGRLMYRCLVNDGAMPSYLSKIQLRWIAGVHIDFRTYVQKHMPSVQ